MLYFVFFVAIKAPAHLQRLLKSDSFHGLDGSMTGLAFHAGRHVTFVREMNEVR